MGNVLDLTKIPKEVLFILELLKEDNEENIKKLSKIAKAYQCVDKVELLPFKKICQTKYDNLGQDFPFKDFETPSQALIKELEAML